MADEEKPKLIGVVIWSGPREKLTDAKIYQALSTMRLKSEYRYGRFLLVLMMCQALVVAVGGMPAWAVVLFTLSQLAAQVAFTGLRAYQSEKEL